MPDPRTPQFVLDAVSTVVSPVYLVGGPVRDALMERPCEDFDFATPLSADAVEAAIVAAGRKAYVVGKRFGTIGMRVGGHAIEITSFEGALEDDLARRDFTINAMAMDGATLIDPHGGARDLEDGVVRATGDAVARLDEDPIRILRAARFASQLGFTVESETVEAMSLLAHRIVDVARERWATELDKLLLGPDAGEAVRLLADSGVLRFVLPEVHLMVGTRMLGSTIQAVDAAPPEIERRWAALLGDAGAAFVAAGEPTTRRSDEAATILSAEIAEKTGLYLRWSNDRRARVRALMLSRGLRTCPISASADS